MFFKKRRERERQAAHERAAQDAKERAIALSWYAPASEAAGDILRVAPLVKDDIAVPVQSRIVSPKPISPHKASESFVVTAQRFVREWAVDLDLREWAVNLDLKRQWQTRHRWVANSLAHLQQRMIDRQNRRDAAIFM